MNEQQGTINADCAQSSHTQRKPQRLAQPQRPQVAQTHGVLVLNKPRGPSSAQCLAGLKRIGQRKIGHAGTLDPMADGVLLVLLGQATKISGYLLEGGEKVYAGTLLLGQRSDTWDAEGIVLETAAWQHISEEDIQNAVRAWKGRSTQEVPPYSAAKHNGQPLYKLARSGKPVPVKLKEIDVNLAEILWVDLPRVHFRVRCSSGTYIRSLAHSLGIRLGCGALLTELTREYSHPFSLENAHELAPILDEPETLSAKVLPVSAALPHWPCITLDARAEADLRNGKALLHVPSMLDHTPCVQEKALMSDGTGQALALSEAAMQDGVLVWTVLRGLWN